MVLEQQNSVFFWKWSKVQELILWQQIVHGLSSVRKSTGVKSSIIIVLHNFTQLLVITRSEIETTLLKVNSAQSKQESIMEEIVDILTVDNTCNSSSSSCKYLFFSSKTQLNLSLLLKESLDHLGVSVMQRRR